MVQKIFCVSFHKSGTTSLHRFMQEAHIASRHYPRDHDGLVLRHQCQPSMPGHEILDILQPVLDSHDCHSDAPWPGLLPEILARYPDAKIILLTRDPEDWWRSLAHHWRLSFVPCVLNQYEQIQYRDYLSGKTIVRLADKPIMIDAYRRHIENVRRLVPQGQLLEARLDDVQLGTKLSHFIGLERVQEFPRVQNKTASLPWLLVARRYWRFGTHLLRQPFRVFSSVR